MLAEQAALAIDNANLFIDMQQANMELTMAYDTTLEGWARALELREPEMQEHNRRVAELASQLAGEVGLSEEQLVHVRRGALLHDIGVMRIPDQIINKPGPLTDEEWKIVRQHPTQAFELLSTIPFLRPALDIPYSHHEKWDGSGYPRKLKGEQVPLVARIFAVVDTWDALMSKRSYRPAWEKERCLEYIKGEAGKHFDPRVVDVFLKMIARQDNLFI
jgi:putative nucleotidyltransferase with HDIG domain